MPDTANSFFLHSAKSVAYGLIAAILLMLLLSLPAALIVQLTPLSESVLPGLAIVINALGVFAGGAVAGYVSKRHGLLIGLLTAALLLLVMLLFGSTTVTELPAKCVYFMLCGMIGGVFGIR
ncbi:MAG: TIGR04086 family membrane protein [Bacillota bacterium]|nr:TIGR04086 family membrane protein [Bacillota bacterium]